MRRGARAVLAAALLAPACVDLSVDPAEIVAIEFAPLPWPSVVAGDTLRDAGGNVAPLVARLFRADGEEATGIEVEFLSRDTVVTIVGGNLVVGDAGESGTARLLASGPGIQSVTRSLEVVPEPDSLSADGTLDTLRWVLPDVPATNVSGDIRVKLLADTGGTSRAPVRSWIVSFRLEFRGQPIPAGDTSLVWLVGDGGRPSTVDTTDAQGIASRRVRVRGGPGLPGQVDTILVFAEARKRGQPLPGSPVRRVLPIRPR